MKALIQKNIKTILLAVLLIKLFVLMILEFRMMILEFGSKNLELLKQSFNFLVLNLELSLVLLIKLFVYKIKSVL